MAQYLNEGSHEINSPFNIKNVYRTYFRHVAVTEQTILPVIPSWDQPLIWSNSGLHCWDQPLTWSNSGIHCWDQPLTWSNSGIHSWNQTLTWSNSGIHSWDQPLTWSNTGIHSWDQPLTWINSGIWTTQLDPNLEKLGYAQLDLTTTNLTLLDETEVLSI